MSTNTRQPDDSDTEDEESLYEQYPEVTDELAERDDEIGALARAVRRRGGDEDA